MAWAGVVMAAVLEIFTLETAIVDSRILRKSRRREA
jgi:hypothetical protein